MTLKQYPVLVANTVPSYLIGIGFTQKWTPLFFNQSQKAINGASIDIGLAATPLHQFELTYELLRDFRGTPYDSANYEFQRLFGFYTQMNGSLGRFLFFNPDDQFSLATPIGTGDGTTTTFTITRSFGDAVIYTANPEPVGQIALSIQPLGYPSTFGNPVVYLNGVVQSSGSYTLSTAVPGNNTITFSAAPGAGVAITMDVGYYYYCQFVEDSLQFEKFSGARWQIASVKLQSCRAGA